MSEEKRFGICKEPFQTCPMIDEVIDGLNEVDKIVHKFKNSEDPEVLRDCLSDILDNLPSERQMENIRENIIAIRSWGEEWKQFAINENYDKEHFESKCQDLEDEIKCLKENPDE